MNSTRFCCNRMNFDSTFTKEAADGHTIDYGVLHGSERIVFIKSGRGSTCRGYEDKYVKMAREIHRKTKSTVICASNPMQCAVSYPMDKEMIEEYAASHGFSQFTLVLIGSSAGAYQNLFLANQIPQTRKILCINMPLMINYHKITRELQTMQDIEKIFVYGTNDPSYRYLPMLEMKKYDIFRAVCIQGADHQFTGMLKEFVLLANFV